MFEGQLFELCFISALEHFPTAFQTQVTKNHTVIGFTQCRI